MSIQSQDIQPATGEAFRRLVAEGGHQVEEWLTGHDDDEKVVLYGDCTRCLTELQLREGPSGERPSKEAAKPCPAVAGADDDWD